MTKLRPEPEKTALAFNQVLQELAASSTTPESSKFEFFTRIQDMVTEFILAQKAVKPSDSDSQVSFHIEQRQPAVGVTPELRNEYWLQLFQLISVQAQGYEQDVTGQC